MLNVDIALSQWFRGRMWECFSNIWRVVWFFKKIKSQKAKVGSISRSLEEADFSKWERYEDL